MKKQLVFIFSIISLTTFSQIGGDNTYDFINLPNAAKSAALGGNIIALPDNDLGLAYHNPALLKEDMHNQIVLNYVNYFTDINYGYISYARNYKDVGNFGIGMQYMNYGEFIEANNLGDKTGTFGASEYAFHLMYSKKIDSMFQFGATLKPVYSQLDTYTSFGLLSDIGISYYNPDRLFMASFVVKNIGSQIKPYNDDNFEPIPFEVQIGISKKLLHAPFRFSLIAHHLETYDLSYQKINNAEPTNVFNSESDAEKVGDDLFENLMRHMIFGMEFLPTENFFVALGLNYKRRRELQISEKPGFTGFSFGFGFKLSKFQFSYGRASYHLAGASNHFSISTNLSEFYKN
jgi:hypothetical protein